MRTLTRALAVGSMVAALALSLPAQVADQAASQPAPDATAAPVAAQQPAKPKVTYENGRLTISANNSTFQEILEAVRQQTGVKIEGVAAVDNSRITVELGPDDPLKVLANLIYGSRFNYIIVSARAEVRPDRIVLMVRDTPPLMAVAPPPAGPKSAASSVQSDQADAQGDNAEKADGAAPADDTEKKKEVADKKDGEGTDKADSDKKASKEETDEEKEKKAAAEAYAKAGQTNLPPQDSAATDPAIAERLANLPEGMNPALAALYPGLSGKGSQANGLGSVGGTAGSSGSVGGYNYMPGSPPSAPAPWNGASLPTTSGGQPILPSNIPPEIWNVYPPNIMDLIRNGGSGAPVVVPSGPLAPGLSVGATGLWDQSIKSPVNNGG